MAELSLDEELLRKLPLPPPPLTLGLPLSEEELSSKDSQLVATLSADCGLETSCVSWIVRRSVSRSIKGGIERDIKVGWWSEMQRGWGCSTANDG